MKDKRVSLYEAAAMIAHGCRLAVGGIVLQRQPVALLYEPIRRGVRDLTITTFVGGNAVDVLVGVGAAKRPESAAIGLGP